MKVLIIAGHPRKDSFSHALAQAYQQGALQARAEVHLLVLADMQFNLHVITPSPRHQHLEEDIVRAQALIRWADHLVFVYPTWWGTMPALLKGFMDRVFTPGFSFNEREGGNGWDQLLTGKSAQLITTMDTPLWVYRWIMKSPGHRAMQQATLGFCGIKPVRILSFSAIKDSSAQERNSWLEKARLAGLQLEGGILTPWEKLKIRLTPWLRALRLQFYPMTWVAYAAGAWGAASMGYGFDQTLFWLGYLWIFLLEVATVFTNDYHDIETDRRNINYSPFTGGSRVLVEGKLSKEAILRAAMLAVGASALAAVLLLLKLPAFPLLIAGFMLLFFVLALGYTLPPLKLSYRGFGELDVGFTHSFAVILSGYMFQGGLPGDAFPWLLSLPLFLAILPSIILAGVPDYEADKAVAKNTLAVLLGRRGAAWLAMGFTLLSAGVAIIWHAFEVVPAAYGAGIYGVLPHAAVLLWLLYRYVKKQDLPDRINLLMVVSLTYLLWFGLVPLLGLM